ncbi:MAG: hypothetical protein AB7O63_08715 [Reyranellaceae bacterium]
MTPRGTGGIARLPRFVLSGGFLLLLALGSCVQTADGPATTGGPRTAALGPATGGPTRLNDLSSTQVVAMLGEPAFRREENPAQIWRYRGETCVLELMLYKLDADLKVRHVEARDEKFRAVAQNACIDSIAASRRKSLRG